MIDVQVIVDALNEGTVQDTPDFQRAYDIHGKHYEGEEISQDEQDFYDEYVRKLANEVIGDKQPGEPVPFGLTIWLMYALKYVTPSYPDHA